MLKIINHCGNPVMIPMENISSVTEGNRGTCYIYLKDGKPPIETTASFNYIQSEMDKYFKR